MSHRRLRKLAVGCGLIATAFCAVAPFAAFAQIDLPAELQRCGLIEDGPQRLNCYDMLSGLQAPVVNQSATAQHEVTEDSGKTTVDPDAADATVSETTVDDSSRYLQIAGQTVDDQEPAEDEVVDQAGAGARTLDDLGSQTLPWGSRDQAERLEVRAKVDRCERDVRKKYLFYFDNGQVWKQTNDRRLNFENCDFNVTITRDFFGYKMTADGDKRQIRISRVK